MATATSQAKSQIPFSSDAKPELDQKEPKWRANTVASIVENFSVSSDLSNVQSYQDGETVQSEVETSPSARSELQKSSDEPLPRSIAKIDEYDVDFS
jgi:hypothetical protein